jgi:membrane fusion protein (multidrug efflux system)
MAEATLEKEHSTEKPVKQSGSPLPKIIGLVVLLAAAGFGYYYWSELQLVESTDDAQIDGRIAAISSRIPGNVVEVKAEDQTFVNKGDVLVRLDAKDFEVQVARVKADLEDALANLQTFRADVPLTTSTTGSTLTGAKSSRTEAAAAVTWAEKQLSVLQAKVALAQANVKVAEANANRASQDVERYKTLVAKDEISRQQFDQAVSTLEAARATVEAQRAAVTEAQSNIAVAQVAVDQAKARLGQADATVESAMTAPQQVAITEARVKAAMARVEQQRAALQQAELNLQYTTISAPYSGIVGRKSVEVGQNLAAGQQMMAIVPLDDVWVTANFKETQLRDMKPGQKVELEVDANRRKYTGTISRISGASGARFSLLPPENASGNYVKVVQRVPVRIDLDPGQNKDFSLRPGMSVTPTVRIH